MTKPEFFEQIDTIEMRVRSAEQKIQLGAHTEQLLITLSLITIARGSCSMMITPSEIKAGFTGQLHIPLNRNVIEAKLLFPEQYFDKFVDQIVRTAEKTITAKMTLNKTLVLDNNGCLIIDEPTDAKIKNLLWSMTLK